MWVKHNIFLNCCPSPRKNANICSSTRPPALSANVLACIQAFYNPTHTVILKWPLRNMQRSITSKSRSSCSSWRVGDRLLCVISLDFPLMPMLYPHILYVLNAAEFLMETGLILIISANELLTQLTSHATWSQNRTIWWNIVETVRQSNISFVLKVHTYAQEQQRLNGKEFAQYCI